jgi:pimeloyl-ACP methyl ester carboxylesterase
MTPLMFGSSSRRLFGIYEPGAGAAHNAKAAVICAPWGEEYLHAHRPLRICAHRLAEAGVHTLRFDYFGTGDSGGDVTDASLRGAESDVLFAVEELKAIADVESVMLIGMRLGANLAMAAAARAPAEITSLVLWDPVVDQDSYFDERRRAVVNPMRIDTPDSYDFGLTPGVVGEITALRPPAVTAPTLVVCTADNPTRMRERFSTDQTVEVEHLPARPVWIEDWPRTIVPVEVIRRIVDWVG